MSFLRLTGNGIQGYRNGTAAANDPASINVPYLFETWYDGTTNYNTVQQGTSTVISSVASSGNFNISSFAIAGDTYTTASEYFNGAIGEILVYNTALTLTQRQSVEGYLSWKWGMQSNLSSTHPYSPTNAWLGPPTSLGVTVGTSQAAIAFTEGAKSSVLTIINYQYSTNGGTTYTAFSPAQTVSPLVITGLIDGTTYTFKLKAVALSGYIVSAGSGAASATNVGIKTDVPIANLDVNGTMRVVGTALVPTLAAATVNSVATSVWSSTSVVATHYNVPFAVPRVVRVTGAAGGIYHVPATRDGFVVPDGAIVTIIAASACTVVGSYIQDGTTPTVLSTAQVSSYSQDLTAGVAAEYYYYGGLGGGLWCRCK
jgi:hypothetical protein